MEKKYFASKLKVFCLVVSLIFALGLIFSPSVQAQIKSTITGRVVDATTGEYLPGANVMIKGTTLGAASDREGKFRIFNVPPGTYEIQVSYIGYEEYSEQVKVTAGQRTVVKDIALKIKAVEVNAVVVEGLREGQIRALSRQRSAVNIKNVVAREQMERFPDENTAEVLQRVPGVYISRSLGDGRYALIRGTPPQLSTVTVDGEQLATNRVEERYTQLDIIGANQMASIEVVKALTPDMDGDAIGGSINLVSRSAFDYSGRRVRLSLGSGYANIDSKPIYQGRFSYSNRFGAKKNFGITFTSNWDRHDRGADNNENDWGNEKDVNDNFIPFALQQLDLRDYQMINDRYGLGTTFEYRPSEHHRFYIRGMWNKFNDNIVRGRMRLRINKGDYLNPQGTLTHKSRIVREQEARDEEEIQGQFSAGGVHQFGNIGLNYDVAYSHASERHMPQLETDWAFDEKVDLALDLSNTEKPKWKITNMDNDLQYDPSHYEFDGIDYRDTRTNDHNLIGSMNLKVPYSLGGLPSELKLGGKIRAKRKDRDEDRYNYKWKGEQNITMDQMVSDYDDKSFMNGEYHFGPTADADKAMDFFKKHRGKDLVGELKYYDSEGQKYTVDEKVYAYYAMTTINMSNLMFLGGFRHEFTDNTLDANQLYFNDSGDFSSLSKIEQKRNYNNFLPMFHLRYRLSSMTNFRAAVTHTISRPNYWDLAPYFFVDPDHEEIVKGNKDLTPTTAWNVDLMGAHYYPGIGIISGGFFYKSLAEIIFVSTFKQQGGVYDGYDVEQPINGGEAKLYGFELNWEQQLTFLPGFLKGFGIYANYTHTWADVDLFGREGFLPGQSGDVGNLAISYEKSGFSSRLSLMYQDKYIDEVGKDKDYDQWRNDHLQIDFSASQQLWSGLQAYLEAINLTNEPRYDYMGITSRPILQEYFSWWMRAGFKFSL